LSEKRKLATQTKAAADALQRQGDATAAAVALAKQEGEAEVSGGSLTV
jgi:hypothetical protein